MWEAQISAGCVAIYSLWIAGMGAILAGGLLGFTTLGQIGLASVGGAISLAIIRDNQRTRRMLARPGENVGPMRSVPRDWV